MIHDAFHVAFCPPLVKGENKFDDEMLNERKKERENVNRDIRTCGILVENIIQNK